MQIGVDARYNTKWYAPGFNPVTGTFYNQHEEQYGETPYFDVFLNMQWKQACIFLKMENAGEGWPTKKHDYFSAIATSTRPRSSSSASPGRSIRPSERPARCPTGPGPA